MALDVRAEKQQVQVSAKVQPEFMKKTAASTGIVGVLVKPCGRGTCHLGSTRGLPQGGRKIPPSLPLLGKSGLSGEWGMELWLGFVFSVRQRWHAGLPTNRIRESDGPKKPLCVH